MASSPITPSQINGEIIETVIDFIFSSLKSLKMMIADMKLKDAYSLEGKLWPTSTAYEKAETLLCSQRSICDLSLNQGCGFASSHVWMWELDYKESWALKNWCFWTVVWEKTLESPLDCKEIQPAHPKGDQSWVFTGRTDAEAETPILHSATWCEELTHLKRLWCWERLKARGKGDDRGWDGWMASPTQWTWAWVNSGSWW